jgi:hypothetical protein
MKLSEKIKKSIAGKQRSEESLDNLVKSEKLLIGSEDVFLSAEEISSLKELLLDNQSHSSNLNADCATLINITGEIKSINHQSVLLHGEKIKAAKELFQSYGDFAFSLWLKQVYGNRQTPYNFLKYYLFYTCLEKRLQEKVLSMPKQIVYSIASRNCSDEDKMKVVDTYDGESKDTYLKAIRKAFPLDTKDRRQKRKTTTASRIISLIDAASEELERNKKTYSLEELLKIDLHLKSFSKKIWED